MKGFKNGEKLSGNEPLNILDIPISGPARSGVKIEKWKSFFFRNQYQKGLHRKESDDTVNYLGYWTDNGAFYYYNTVEGKNYQDTMMDVYDEIRFGQTNAPFRSDY